ncbi:hypothetical protein [Georgenia yuyongxinii]|uniref:DUF2804 family protein n=1 Tax=Georgenia yuyongxinii TaxID=2589797 RepID=A0A552WUF6_9MICO|nr:hypothetical protein [Georgenia yuyongxinii]TRW45963.1 hypothetical protein FJ693_07320 [Georgenia yuyongxinii]
MRDGIGPMRDQQVDLAARGTALEYWFAKLDADDVSFLVDFIVRRQTGTAQVRVCTWVRGAGRVRHGVPTSAWRAAGTTVTVEDDVLTARGTSGHVADVAWDLAFEPGPARIAPRLPLLGALHPLDLELVSRPRATFQGAVTVAGERFPVDDGDGTVTHYWGRRLPDRWRWISVSASGSGPAVEAVVITTRLWGRRPGLSAGYLWWGDPTVGRLLVSPTTGLLTARGSGSRFTLTGRGPRLRLTVHATARPADMLDLGEGIRQSLAGRVAVPAQGWVSGRAGVEQRHLG